MILNVRNTLAPLALVAVILSSAACKGNSVGADKEVSKEAEKAEKRAQLKRVELATIALQEATTAELHARDIDIFEKQQNYYRS